MTTNRIIFFLSTLLFIPFFIVFFRYDYVPITDESYQLQAAKRLVEGRGLTSNLGANPFNDTEYQYLYQWPPGYSILIASLVHLGFSISSSAILIKTATILMGLYFWIKLSSHYLDSLAPKIIFMSITSFMVFTYNYLQTDLIIWSIFPIYSLYMLRLNDKKKRNGESLILIATCLVLFILFKFHTVVFYPITLAWLVYVFYSDLRKLISYSLAIMVPGVLTGLLIRDINLKLAHTTTDVVNINNFNLHGLINIRLLTEKLYIFLEYFFIRPLRLEFITIYASSRTQILSNQSLITVTTLIAFLLSVWIIALSYKRKDISRTLIVWFLTNVTLFIIFYFILYLVSGDPYTFWPFSRSRYHLAIITFFYLLFVLASSSKRNILKIIFTNKTIAGSIYLSIFLTISLSSFISVNARYRQYNKTKKLLQDKITKLQTNELLDFAVADKPYNEMLTYNNFIPAYRLNIFNEVNKETLTNHSYLLIVDEKNIGKDDDAIENLIPNHKPELFRVNSLNLYYFK